MTDTTTDPRLFSRDPAERRAFLSEVGEGIAYFIPPELRSRFQFLAEMTPSAAVERAGQASQRVFDADRTAMERVGDFGTMLSEMAGVAAPFAVAPRAAMPAAEAAQEAFLGFSVPARAAAETAFERLNQPGPMPEVLYSGFDPAAMLARRNAQESSFQYGVMVNSGVDPEIARQRVLRDYGVDPVPPTAARGPDPLPAPRNSAEENADEVARLLREGKVDEAEALLGFADDRRLYQLYERGEVGMDLPMDFASVQARGREMGFVEDEFIGSMEPGIRSLDPRMARGDRMYAGTFSSDNPYVASSYADPRLGSVYPLLTRGLPENAVRFDAEGQLWNRLPGFSEADIGGRSTGPISVRLANMGESAMRGQYDTNQLSRIAFFEGLPGAEFRNVVDRGPMAPIDPGDPSVARLFQERGAEPSTVRSRQDTRGVRSRFARFDPRFAGSRNLMAGVGGAGVMVAASDDDEEPAVRGYAQGGAVMMRSGMPEQIHQGLGSLSEVARRMFMGGEVSGHPLDQYGQYLTQTYAQPVQQAVSQFVDSVREREQQFFGGGGMGAGMGAGMGGGMGSPTDAGSTLAVGGLSAPMGQVGILTQDPSQVAMQLGTFDAQVAAAKNTPPSPSFTVGQKLRYESPSRGLGVPQMSFAMQSPRQGGLMGSPMQPSGVSVNQANLAGAQFTAPSAAPGTTVYDAFASRFGENWADQFSLTTPNNRARLGIV